MQQLEIQTVPGYEVLNARVQRWINTFGVPELVAVVVSDGAVSYGIVRMLMGASGALSERVDVFTTRDAAVAWLTGAHRDGAE
ncbi:hypothetical protein LuPra_02236 [Luteitalea pratensis]|uniref:Uncharacterized protein n=2 Tax=Luteitalea pratensis TaxID=1855912 RepID=A0A143PKF6_LUTPR|nr:hypothetical protein LuPra_02236 [Luteitalea pratensis]